MLVSIMLLGPCSSSKINVLVIQALEREWRIYHIKFRDLLLKISGGPVFCSLLSPSKWKSPKGSLYCILIKKKCNSLWTYLGFGLIHNTCGYVALTFLSSELLTKLVTNSGARAREGIPADLGCSTSSPSPWSNRSNGACDIFGRLTCYIKHTQVQIRELQ